MFVDRLKETMKEKLFNSTSSATAGQTMKSLQIEKRFFFHFNHNNI